MQIHDDVVRGARALRPDAAFLVGRDRDGHWLAVEIRGRRGGIFSTKAAALHYAWTETAHRPDAILLTPDPLALS